MLFTLLPVTALAAGAEQFDDVKADSWYYSYVDYVADKGYFQGTSDTTFSPELTMTRAMFVTAVSRVAGKTGDAAVAPFDDVPANTWYTGAVDWAVENGVINGIGGNKFNPDKEITREDMCVTMARFVSYLETSEKKTFKKDADPIQFPDAGQISSYAKAAVDSCVAYGLVYGTGDGDFRPKDNATRAEVAAVIYRLSLMTTQPTGGGITSNIPAGPNPTSYTITFKDGAETVGTVTTASNTSTEKTFTTLAAPAAEDKVFVNWNTEADGTGDAYAANTQYTATGNMTLYAQWTPQTVTYTLTLNPNYEGATTTNRTVASGNPYCFVSGDVPIRVGYRFLGWNTAADGTGTTYNVGDSITVTGNVTVFAMWMVVDTDYIGQAVLSAADWASGYVDTVNSVLDSVKGTAQGAGLAIEDTLNISLTTDNMTSMEAGARTITVSAQADLTENTVLNAARFAMKMVIPVVNGKIPPADLKQMIKDMAEQLGIELTKEQVGQMVDEIQQAAQSYLAQVMQDFKDNFRNYNGGDCIDGLTLTFANGDEMTLTVGSITKNDAVQVAVKIARNMLNSANSTEYTDQFDAQTSVKVSFMPVSAIAAFYTGEGAFPTDYTVKFVLDAQSDYLSYKLDPDNGYYLKLTISQEMQDGYAKAVDKLVDAALDNPGIRTRLDTLLNNALAGVSLDSYKGLLTQLGKTEDEAQQMLDGAVDAWVAANYLSGAEIKDSFLYKRYWEEDDTAVPDNTNLYALIAEISDGDVAGAYVDALLREKIGDMYVEPAPGKWDDREGYVDYALMRDPTSPDGAGLYYKMTPEVFDALISAALPGGAGFTLNINDPVQYYVLGAVCDYLHSLVGEKTTYAAGAEAAMEDAIDQKLDDMLAGNNMMTVLEKAVKVKTLEGIWNAKLSNVATVLENPTVQSLASNYDDNTYIDQLRDAFNAVVKRIPAGAMVQIGGTTLTKASLDGVVKADGNAALCQALADLITDNGLDQLSLSTFSDETTAPKITVGSSSTNVAFTLILELESPAP